MATVEREVTFSEPVNKSSQLPILPDGGETTFANNKVTFESDVESDGEYAHHMGGRQRQRTHSASSQSSTFSNEAER